MKTKSLRNERMICKMYVLAPKSVQTEKKYQTFIRQNFKSLISQKLKVFFLISGDDSVQNI